MGWMDSPLRGAGRQPWSSSSTPVRARGRSLMSLVALVAHHGRAEAAVLTRPWPSTGSTTHGHEACLLVDDADAVGLPSISA